ncbi:hypothetical protein [uncultured Shewanella sp.]|uniref:hypothetical protein n=1 Tax=uncultured Shewanella sp. TaxID=173975 RepID=UPI0026079A6F|nr:hypothetical protein [uncultured Shewanella sp.]
MIKQVFAVFCIALMLSINAYACTEKIILPIEDHADVATHSVQGIDSAQVKETLVQSTSSKQSLLAQKNTSSQASATKVSHSQGADHQPVSPLSSSLPVNRGATFIPLGTQAYLSFIQHDLVEIQPEYQLAFEFSPPIIPSFKVGYRIDANNPSWFLTTFSKSARVSGWKESNLIYRFTQQIS